MLNGIHVDANANSKYFKIKNGRNEIICKVTDLENALKLVNEIKKLQGDSKKAFDKLVKATYYNGIYLDAIVEAMNNNNPAPARKILSDIDPKFSKNHTTPNQFTTLNESHQRLIVNEIKIHKGDVFYHKQSKKFIIHESSNETVHTFYVGETFTGYCCEKGKILDELIPCYTIHQLWNFLESYLNEPIEIRLKGEMYRVYSHKLERDLGIGDTKIDALWNSTVNVIK